MSKKLHWTQTPEGRERMRQIQRQRFAPKPKPQLSVVPKVRLELWVKGSDGQWVRSVHTARSVLDAFAIVTDAYLLQSFQIGSLVLSITSKG